ncbi:MAG: SDR family oxidoreductase [Candidatus Methylomirabilales bacterium]
MILVAGATGRVGSQVVEQLRRQGRPVRALVRSEVKAKPLREAGVEIALGDITKRSTLEAACQGVKTVISMVTSLNPAMGQIYNPETIEEGGHQDLLQVARRSGVSHVMYLSAIDVEHPEAPRQFRVKRLVEQVVMGSGVPYTILRPSGFMENLLPMLPAIRRFGVAPLPGKGTVRISYIAVEDVARAAVQAVDRPEAQGAVIEYGGPDDLTNRQCAEIAAKVFGRSVRVVPIPLALFHLVGRLAQPLSPGLREFFAIMDFVDRYGLRAPHRPPLRDKSWTPISFEGFVRRHTSGVRF